MAAALECLLFLAEEPLPEADLARMLEVTPTRTRELLDELSRQYEGRGLQLVKIAGGWQLRTRTEYAPYISRLHEPEKLRLSRPALETLAIIAYRQPVTRPEMEAIRGVNVDGVVSTLLSHNLIEERGRKEAPGRPMLYGTTREFLNHFGIDKLEDLPELPATEEAAAEAEAAALLPQQDASDSPAPESAADDSPTPPQPTVEDVKDADDLSGQTTQSQQ